MFLVEREPGNVAVYNSQAELSGAIREGVIGPTARIYHRRSSQWLPITEHPTYRQVRAEAEQERLPPLRRKHWTFLPHSAADAAAHEVSTARPQGHGEGAAGVSKTEKSAEETESKPGRAWWRMSLRRRLSRGQGEPS